MGYDKVPGRSDATERRRKLNRVDVEEVFTFLSERVRAPSTSPQLRRYAAAIWDDLVAEVGNVFRRFSPNTETRRVFRALHKNHIKSFDAVVSFNYDTVFEDSLPQRISWAYEGLENCTKCLPILKPHGSINWAYSEGTIERAVDPPQCVVVAPTHLKFVLSRSIEGLDSENSDEAAQGKHAREYSGYLDQSHQIQTIWTALEKEMREARALVFIGYSFPVADLYFSSLLRSVLATRDSPPAIVLVNPDAVALAERLSRRFSVDQPIRYFDMNQFVQATRADVFSHIR